MKRKEILEGNTLIGVFMGATFVNDATDAYPDGYYTGIEHSLNPEVWQYHESWDWLKPVVDRIGEYSLAHEEAKLVTKCSIIIDIEPLWNKVVQFITWLNQQPK